MARRPVRQSVVEATEQAPAWTSEGAYQRLKNNDALTEYDDAYFWWQELEGALSEKVATAVGLLRRKWGVPQELGWISAYPGAEASWLPHAVLAQFGKAYVEHLTPAELHGPMDPTRAAAEFLIAYAEIVDLTGAFGGVMDDTPDPLRPIEAARCAMLGARLGALGEAFDPQQGGLNPSVLDQVERQRLARLKGAKARARKADEAWRAPVLQRASELRAAHPDWGDDAVAARIVGEPPEGVTAPLTTEKVRRLVARAGAGGGIPRSTKHPSQRT